VIEAQCPLWNWISLAEPNAFMARTYYLSAITIKHRATDPGRLTWIRLSVSGIFIGYGLLSKWGSSPKAAAALQQAKSAFQRPNTLCGISWWGLRRIMGENGSRAGILHDSNKWPAG